MKKTEIFWLRRRRFIRPFQPSTPPLQSGPHRLLTNQNMPKTIKGVFAYIIATNMRTNEKLTYTTATNIIDVSNNNNRIDKYMRKSKNNYLINGKKIMNSKVSGCLIHSNKLKIKIQ
jgi:hypothetical protein